MKASVRTLNYKISELQLSAATYNSQLTTHNSRFHHHFLPLLLQLFQLLPDHSTLIIQALHDMVKPLSGAGDIDERLADLLLDEEIGNQVIKEYIGKAAEVFDLHVGIELHALKDILQLVAEAD